MLFRSIRRRGAGPTQRKAVGAEVAAEVGVEARRNLNILVNAQRENTGTEAEALVAADLRSAKGRERRRTREGKKSRRKRIRRRNEAFLPGKRQAFQPFFQPCSLFDNGPITTDQVEGQEG